MMEVSGQKVIIFVTTGVQESLLISHHTHINVSGFSPDLEMTINFFAVGDTVER